MPLYDLAGAPQTVDRLELLGRELTRPIRLDPVLANRRGKALFHCIIPGGCGDAPLPGGIAGGMGGIDASVSAVCSKVSSN